MANLSKAIARGFLLQLLLVTGTAGAARGADPVLGEWKLDILRSRYRQGPGPRSFFFFKQKTAYEIRVRVTTVDARGKTETTEYPTNFDGKDYIQPGTNPGDTVSLTRHNDYHASAVLNHADKIIANVERSISDDGQTMTITFKGTVPNGDVVDNLSIYTQVQPKTAR